MKPIHTQTYIFNIHLCCMKTVTKHIKGVIVRVIVGLCKLVNTGVPAK